MQYKIILLVLISLLLFNCGDGVENEKRDNIIQENFVNNIYKMYNLFDQLKMQGLNSNIFVDSTNYTINDYPVNITRPQDDYVLILSFVYQNKGAWDSSNNRFKREVKRDVLDTANRTIEELGFYYHKILTQENTNTEIYLGNYAPTISDKDSDKFILSFVFYRYDDPIIKKEKGAILYFIVFLLFTIVAMVFSYMPPAMRRLEIIIISLAIGLIITLFLPTTNTVIAIGLMFILLICELIFIVDTIDTIVNFVTINNILLKALLPIMYIVIIFSIIDEPYPHKTIETGIWGLIILTMSIHVFLNHAHKKIIVGTILLSISYCCLYCGKMENFILDSQINKLVLSPELTLFIILLFMFLVGLLLVIDQTFALIALTGILLLLYKNTIIDLDKLLFFSILPATISYCNMIYKNRFSLFSDSAYSS